VAAEGGEEEEARPCAPHDGQAQGGEEGPVPSQAGINRDIFGGKFRRTVHDPVHQPCVDVVVVRLILRAVVPQRGNVAQAEATVARASEPLCPLLRLCGAAKP